MLNSDRLTLKKPTLADAPAIAKYLNRKDTAHMMSHVPYPYTLDDAHEFITGTAAKIHNDLFNAIYNKTNDFMGIVGIIPKPTGDEIAYWLGHPFWGNGYMTEAASLIIDEFFKVTDKQELFVNHLLSNDKSKSTILKLGFTYVSDVILDAPARKTAEQAKHYQLTKQDWQAKNA
ncbi:MAG: GNAT family N-acetyltransferase [Alphaproteobacteria bacterium]|nr:GNAT family N-acetyltransferase [Alphaproteobacteria bacterium]